MERSRPFTTRGAQPMLLAEHFCFYFILFLFFFVLFLFFYVVGRTNRKDCAPCFWRGPPLPSPSWGRPTHPRREPAGFRGSRRPMIGSSSLFLGFWAQGSWNHPGTRSCRFCTCIILSLLVVLSVFCYVFCIILLCILYYCIILSFLYVFCIILSFLVVLAHMVRQSDSSRGPQNPRD